MDNSGAYMAFDILESLKNFRDSRRCLDGLNKLRAALKSEDGPRAQENAVSINLMLAISDIFATSARSSRASSHATTAATTLANAILSRRIKSIYSHLASQQRNRASAALILLAELVSLGPAMGRELTRVFDFGLPALPQLARPLRARKGESTLEASTRQQQEWASEDPVRRPTRAAFIGLALSLLRCADAQLLPEVLRLRPLLGGMMQSLSNDPPMIQLEVLKVLQKRVLGARASIGPAAKAEFFNDAALGQLASVCAAGEDYDTTESTSENEEEKGEKKENEKETSASAIGSVRRHASDLSFQILHAVCIDPQQGICISSEASDEFRTLQASSTTALSPGQRRLLRWLQRLHPAESARHGELLRAATGHDPSLAAAMLLSVQYAMEPMATGRWLVHAGVVGSLVQSLARVKIGLLEIAERGLPPPELSGRNSQAALRCALPPSLPRAALSRGVQHGNALVRHAVLCLLGHMLTALGGVVTSAAEATAALPPSASPTLHSQWSHLSSSIQHAARAALPDLQPILAQLSVASGTAKGTQKTTLPTSKKERATGAENNVKNVESEDVAVEQEDDEEMVEGESIKGINTALFSATMHVLRLWRVCLPASFPESNIDVEKLIPEDLNALPPLHQLQFISLLDAESRSSAGGTSVFSLSSLGDRGSFGLPEVRQAGSAGVGPALLPVLRLLASSELAEVRGAAAAWAVRRLTATGLFESNPAEAFLWVDLIPVGTGVEAAFLNDALGLVLRRPGEFYSLLDMAAGCSKPEVSLLVLCALRQVLRVMGSEKKGMDDKTAIAGYVSRVAALAVMQQTGEGAATAMGAALLGVLRSEATRAADGGTTPAKKKETGGKRKAEAIDGEESIAAVHTMLQALGPAAQPLSILASWLESSSSIGPVNGRMEANEGEVPKKKKKSKKEKSKGADAEKSASTEKDNLASSAVSWTLFPSTEALQTDSSESINAGDLLKKVPHYLLPLGVARLSSVVQFEGRTLNRQGSQRAALVIRQALYLLPRLANAAAPLCALVKDAVTSASKASGQEAIRCLELCCSSGNLLNAIEIATTAAEENNRTSAEVISLIQWLLASVESTAALAQGAACQPAVALVLQQIARAAKEGFEKPPSSALSQLIPAAVAAAQGDQAEAAQTAISAVFDHLEANSKSIAREWIAVAGEALGALFNKVSDLADAGGVEVLKRGCRAVTGLLASQRSSEACDLLEKLLHPASWRPHVLRLLGPDTISAAMKVCLTDPNAQKSTIACVLLELSSTARGAMEAALQEGAVLSALGASPAKKLKKKDKKRKEGGNLATIAALLPPLSTFVHLEAKARRKVGEEDKAFPPGGVQQAATQFTDELLNWLSNPSGQPEAVADDLEERNGTAGLLHTWGIKCLTQVLPLARPSQARVLEALAALVNAKESRWDVAPSALAVGSPAATSVEKAAAVDTLLQYLLQYHPITGTAEITSSWLTAELLAPIARSFFLTLSAFFKIKAPTPAQQAAERAFLRLLDASLSDAVAVLPDSERSATAFSTLTTEACTEFGTAVLRRRAEDPLSMRVLRRFAAALLPSGIIGESEDTDFDEITNLAVSSTAAELFQRVLSHSHFISTMRDTAASPLPLPAVAAALPLPLQSLLPLADAPLEKDPSAEENHQRKEENSILLEYPLTLAATEQVSGPTTSNLSQVKRELCMLLETLLDVESTYKPAQSSNSSNINKELVSAEAALLPVVMAAYGGSMSAVDVAVWDLARSLNLRAWRRNSGGGGGGQGSGAMEIDNNSREEEEEEEEEVASREELQALLEGPLADTCFAWGPAAVAAAAALTTATHVSEASASSPQLQALQSKLALDPLRCALTVTHFPDQRALFGANNPLSSEPSTTTGIKDLPPLVPTHPAAYDPSFLLPFCVGALRRGLLPPRLFTQIGLSSVCLRANAAKDPALRALAYECLGLLIQQVQPQRSMGGVGSTGSTGTAGALSTNSASGSDFKERAQLCSLLEWVRDGLSAPFVRLPAVHAVFAAEAALLLGHPAHPMFGPVSKARLKTATLDLSLVPLFRQTILSGSQDARTERAWLLRLLRAGLRSGADARVYLRQYIFELVMGLYDTPIADPGAAKLSLGVVVAACAVPRAARELTDRSGFIGWLASRAAEAIACAVAANSSKAATGRFDDALHAVDALRMLTMVRAVVGKAEGGAGRGSTRAAEDFAQGCRCMLSVLCEVSHGNANSFTHPQAVGLTSIWASVLPLCTWTARATAAVQVPFLSQSEAEVAVKAAEGVFTRLKIENLKEEETTGGVACAGRELIAACAPNSK